MTVYMYIFEDGACRQSEREPTDEALQSIAEGLLNVVCVLHGRFHFLRPNKEWGLVAELPLQ